MFRLIFFLLFPVLSYSQVTIINRSLTDSSLNIAYIGIDNQIELIGYKSSGKLIFSTTNGTLTDLGQNRYVLNPMKKGESIISFQKNGKKIATKSFRVDTLGKTIARLAGVRDSFATSQQIIINPILIVEILGSFYDHKYHITSFRATFFGGHLESENQQDFVTGNIIPDQVLKKLKFLKTGDIIFFDEIRCISPDGRARKLSPFKVIIKQRLNYTSPPSTSSLSHRLNTHQTPSNDQ